MASAREISAGPLAEEVCEEALGSASGCACGRGASGLSCARIGALRNGARSEKQRGKAERWRKGRMANVHSIPKRRIARLQCTFCRLNPGLIGAREGNGFRRQSYGKSRTLRVGPCQGERAA